MAKEKLFTPEDFDKPKDKDWWKWWKKNWKKVIGCIIGILIVAIIVLCCIVCGKNKQKEEVVGQEQTEQVPVNPDTLVTKIETEGVETDTNNGPQEITTGGPIVKPGLEPGAETPKPEVKQGVDTITPPVQPTIEQEAMNVIRGDYGNVPERRKKLGSEYQEIQNRVNQLKKEGVF